MFKLSTKTAADSLIAFSFIGSIATYPFQQHLWGQYCFIGFSAATVGGLADSFAVSALFRNPLGIKWPEKMGTRIISKNRERFLRELVNMVQNELLTVESLREKLNNYRFTEVILTYLNYHGGKGDVGSILQRLASDILTKMDLPEMVKSVESFILEHAGAIQMSDIIADIGEWSIRHRYDERILHFLTDELIKIIKSQEFRSILEELIEAVLHSYESGSWRKKAVNNIMGIKADSYSGKVQSWLADQLENFRSPSHPFRKQLSNWIGAIIIQLRKDELLRYRVEQMKLNLIHSFQKRIELDAVLQEWLEGYRQVAAASEIGEIPFPWLNSMLDEGLHKLQDDSVKLDQLDRWFKDKAMIWIEEEHDQIGQFVWEKLNAFTEQELVRYIEDKAGKDLQYIRLNGTVVGALVGIILFIVKTITEQLIS
ncbi:Uncharacterized membrane-anchored protein YjiN, DUF445 family [Paenibacillus sp. yr247]|uniref:DUF445 domain-containing protein n=1 Tax=Paenibacillus sp. yr247 TaxID=1761880 RepID=UPI00088EC13E|nr:DUF445 domain-containing protein [Paenibacillus sp. yr247]SDO87617.1 Uncharacterized membrane-anchored protein YjiN, DUF445 family [Paenibacillus sp. yr247]